MYRRAQYTHLFGLAVLTFAAIISLVCFVFVKPFWFGWLLASTEMLIGWIMFREYAKKAVIIWHHAERISKGKCSHPNSITIDI